MERIIGSSFLRWAFDNDLYGQNQYAYSTGRSHKDALAVNICNWLIMLENGDAIGLYCSDVSGAFDRVRKERLISKLRLSGLNPRIIRFLESWLDDRQSVVVVGGAISGLRTLYNSVFQGTVLGPPLWNVFYKDAAQSIRRYNFTEVVLPTTSIRGALSIVKLGMMRFYHLAANVRLYCMLGGVLIVSLLIRAKNPSTCFIVCVE